MSCISFDINCTHLREHTAQSKNHQTTKGTVKCSNSTLSMTKHNTQDFTCFLCRKLIIFFYVACSPIAGYGLILEVFRDHTRHATFGRTPLDEWSARLRDLHLTTHNTHNRQTPMPLAGFEPTISAGERPQTYALDRAATATGRKSVITAH